MILGMTPFVFFHVVVSLIAIGAGIVVAFGILKSEKLSGWTAAFLGLTILTCLTGFGLHADRILPSHIIGVLTLLAAIIAAYVFYSSRLIGSSRWVFVVSAMLGLYLNVFVLVFQSFLKIARLHELAPTQSEPPFAIAQGIVLVAFVILGWSGIRQFHPAY